MSERIEPPARRIVLYGAVGAVSGFAVVAFGLFVLFASTAFSPVAALLGIALLAGPGLAVWVMARNPDQRPASEEHYLLPLVQLASLAERLDRRGVLLAVVAGTAGQVALASFSPVAALLALFAGLAALWWLDPAVVHREPDRRTEPRTVVFPADPTGILARVLVLVVGSAFVLVGLALGGVLVTRWMGGPPVEARLVAGLGIASLVMVLFGGTFVSLGLGIGRL